MLNKVSILSCQSNIQFDGSDLECTEFIPRPTISWPTSSDPYIRMLSTQASYFGPDGAVFVFSHTFFLNFTRLVFW